MCSLAKTTKEVREAIMTLVDDYILTGATIHCWLLSFWAMAVTTAPFFHN